MNHFNINLKQNSNEWHKHRQNYINASEVSIIMDLNPFETKQNLLKRKLFGEKIKDNKAMYHGRTLEPEARNLFNEINKTKFQPAVFVKNFFSASLDGWHKDSQTILEIKCPISLNTSTWQNFIMNDRIPIFYYAQIQAQLYCSEADKAFFLVYQTYQNLKVKEIFKNKNFIDDMYQKCHNFYDIFLQMKNFIKKLDTNNE
ncbi:lambda-exonuclease family protein [Candidatus Phytoplasma pini]|uniref:YqaJ viral recombinase domain-containing protein n=1 Tax=Candidatus Phytoplasma pini TaxID=267362 RepID=A0A559KJG1_9MOLU|nr:YqaJ viral recombinase family protein [Candidatus Phytoplasma pini]TVY12275.1 hypothetical protein MDPP_00222 [Candidatus Phytoplasma pini]